MADILAENLSGKSVMGADGSELGLLYNVTMDVQSGRLLNLLVTPDEENPPTGVDYERDDAGRFQVPVGDVQAVKDYIIVQR